MGCASSTTYHTDPHTGQENQKKRLGGAYPGQRRPQHQPYTPPEDSFAGGNKATQHFVAHGGGNALTLAKPDGSPIPPASGGPFKEYIQVTLPDGVKAGDTIHVMSPSGKTNAIVVPSGFGPGSTFTVEFADEMSTPASKPGASNYSDDVNVNNHQQYNNNSSSSNNNNNNNSSSTNPPPDQGPDDGFATGFNNPQWHPSATAVQEPEVHVSSTSGDYHGNYPSATATPVYSLPPYSYRR